LLTTVLAAVRKYLFDEQLTVTTQQTRQSKIKSWTKKTYRRL